MNRFFYVFYIFGSLMYSVVVGAFLGFFGGLFSWPQYLVYRLKVNAAHYKYYPKSTQKKYVDDQLSQISSAKDVAEKRFEFDTGNQGLPHPLIESIIIVLMYVPLLIYLPIKGLFYGPYHAFERCMFYWQDHLKKES